MGKNNNQNQNQQSQGQGQGQEFVSPTPPTDPVFISLTKDDLIELLREARRDPKTEAKIEAEAQRVEARRRQMVMLAKQDEKAKLEREKRCRHRKPNGEETSGGQEFSDGRIRIFCLRCQKTLRSYFSPQVAMGMAIRDKMMALGMTDADIRERMQFEGEGNIDIDVQDDFMLGMPRGANLESLTTENQYGSDSSRNGIGDGDGQE